MREKNIFEGEPTSKQRERIERMDDLQVRLSEKLRAMFPEGSAAYEELFLAGLDPNPYPDTFRRIYAEAMGRKKAKRMRAIRAAVMILSVLAAGALSATYVLQTPAVADFFKAAKLNNDPTTTRRERPHSDINEDSLTFTYKKWDMVLRYDTINDIFLLPTYIPDGYTFVKFTVIKDYYEFIFITEFKDSDGVPLAIVQYGKLDPVVVITSLPEAETQKILDNLH